MIVFLGAYQDPADHVQKYVFEDENGVIEITHIHNKDRDTYCIPSMYMCKLGCKFCHCTTENLQGSPLPIKVDTIKKILGKIPRNKDEVLYSIMGMGDPLLNLDLIVGLKEICDWRGRVSISTICPKNGAPLQAVPGGVKIHYSLHNPIEEKRKLLIPAPTVPIEKVFIKLHWMYQVQSRQSEIHYTLIDGVNDGMPELGKMISLSEHYKIPIKFLEFNETSGLKKSRYLKVWMDTLKSIVTVEHYTPPGLSIGSSCGQFTKYFYTNNNYAEFQEFKKKYRLFQ